MAEVKTEPNELKSMQVSEIKTEADDDLFVTRRDNMVASDLLFYAQNKLPSITTNIDELFATCRDFYAVECVKKAAQRFFQSIGRDPARTTTDDKERNLRDILNEMRSRMATGAFLPTFVAVNLSNLPPPEDVSGKQNAEILRSLREMREESASVASSLKTDLVRSVQSAMTTASRAADYSSSPPEKVCVIEREGSSITLGIDGNASRSYYLGNRFEQISAALAGSVIVIDSDEQHIDIEVVIGKNLLNYRMNKFSPFQKLADRLADIMDVYPTSLRLCVNGNCVTLEQTPADVGMKNGDSAWVFREQPFWGKDGVGKGGGVIWEESYDGSSNDAVQVRVTIGRNVIIYKLKKDDTFSKLFKVVEKITHLRPHESRIICAGRRVNSTDTPSSFPGLKEDVWPFELFKPQPWEGPIATNPSFIWRDFDSNRAASPSPSMIHVKVVYHGKTVYFAVKDDQRLGRVFDIFCELADLRRDAVDFKFADDIVSDLSKPKFIQEGMGDGAVLEVRKKPPEKDLRVDRVALTFIFGEQEFAQWVRRSCEFVHIKNAMCIKHAIDGTRLRLVFRGRLLAENCTPLSMNMKDGDRLLIREYPEPTRKADIVLPISQCPNPPLFKPGELESLKRERTANT